MVRTAPPRPPAVPPRSPEEGAARVTSAVVPIFDNRDGHGADWRLIVESMFKAAFVMLDGLPEDARVSIARRVHEGAYSRMVPEPMGGDDETSYFGPPTSNLAPSNTAGLKSYVPKPPR